MRATRLAPPKPEDPPVERMDLCPESFTVECSLSVPIAVRTPALVSNPVPVPIPVRVAAIIPERLSVEGWKYWRVTYWSMEPLSHFTLKLVFARLSDVTRSVRMRRRLVFGGRGRGWGAGELVWGGFAVAGRS
jgi:hypothetical protein